MTAAKGPEGLLPLHPRYELVSYINSGSFSQVVLASDKQTGEQVALKFIKRGRQINKYVEREIINHMSLQHPHVVWLQEVFLTPTHLVLVLEYCPGGDLFHYVTARKGGLSEDEARWFFQQLMVAVDYCHRMGVTNRDIKLENILLDSSPRPLLKLADFGFSKDAVQHSAPSTLVGTPAYLAPEVVLNHPGQHYDGQRADVWSCGVALYVMATGQYPFRRATDEGQVAKQRMNAMLRRIAAARFEEPRCSSELRDLLGKILVREPEGRLDIKGIMQHPWVAEGMPSDLLAFNDSFVGAGSKQAASEAVLWEVRALVKEAATMRRSPGDKAGAAPDQEPQQDTEDSQLAPRVNSSTTRLINELAMMGSGEILDLVSPESIAALLSGPAAPQDGAAAPQDGAAAPHSGPATPQNGTPIPQNGSTAPDAAAAAGKQQRAPWRRSLAQLLPHLKSKKK